MRLQCVRYTYLYSVLISAKYFFDFQDNEKLKLIQAIMREVMTMRSSLVASKMTMEEAKETRQKVTTKMDFLNHRLGNCDWKY